MRRINSPGSVAGQFVDEDEATNTPGTILDAAWLNSIQEEVANVVEAAGITLDEDEDDQLLKAIRHMVAGTDLIVRYTTTGNIDAAGLAVQAGGDWAAPLTAGDFILRKNQVIPEDNGWFIAAPGMWPRIPYLDSSAEIQPGKLTKVTEGVTLADSMWMLTTDAPIVLNASHLIFERKDQNFTQAMADARYLRDLFLWVRDEKTTGTTGGTFTAGAYQTRTLNTVKTNLIPGAALSGNQITLPAGTYVVEANAPAFTVGRHKARLQNITDATPLVIGSNAFTSGATSASSNSIIGGRFTLSGTKVIELQHQCTTTSSGNGFGDFSGFGDVEVYADVKIRKVA